MEYLFIILFCIFAIAVLYIITNVKMKQIKQMAENEELDELAKTFPDNIEICQNILEKLGNTKTKIKQNPEEKTTSLYLIFNDTIQIGSIQNTYTRIQTIAHECLHAVQDKRMLWFNFIYSNLYYLYFIILSIITIINAVWGNADSSPNYLIHITILALSGFIYYMIRSFLEMDAMTKARYLAKEYMETKSITNQENIDKIIAGYDQLNDLGIKLTNLVLFSNCIIKVILYSIIVLMINIIK